MYANNLEQLINFLCFIFTGVFLGIIFDVFRILRRTIKTSDIITNIEDILFGVITGIIILISIFKFNNGELRLYIFIGIVLGIILYILSISKYFIKINVTIINSIKKIMTLIFQPLKFLFKYIKKIFLRPISFIVINIKKIIYNCPIKAKKIQKKSKKILHKKDFAMICRKI